jgi:hypothetical protein
VLLKHGAGFLQVFLSGSFTDSIQSMNLKPCFQILHLHDGWVAMIIPREGQITGAINGARKGK